MQSIYNPNEFQKIVVWVDAVLESTGRRRYGKHSTIHTNYDISVLVERISYIEELQINLPVLLEWLSKTDILYKVTAETDYQIKIQFANSEAAGAENIVLNSWD